MHDVDFDISEQNKYTYPTVYTTVHLLINCLVHLSFIKDLRFELSAITLSAFCRRLNDYHDHRY